MNKSLKSNVGFLFGTRRWEWAVGPFLVFYVCAYIVKLTSDGRPQVDRKRTFRAQRRARRDGDSIVPIAFQMVQAAL